MVQGGITSGILNALVAMDTPGPGTVFMSQEFNYKAPVYIDDTITAEAEVLSIHETKPVSQLGFVIKRQNGDVVFEGNAWCYTFHPETV